MDSGWAGLKVRVGMGRGKGESRHTYMEKKVTRRWDKKKFTTFKN